IIGDVAAEPNHAYLVDSINRVTLTLPALPGFGDTVRVSGGGSGGWKIGQNDGQSILRGNLGLGDVKKRCQILNRNRGGLRAVGCGSRAVISLHCHRCVPSSIMVQ